MHRRKDVFVAVAVDIIRFQSYGLQDNVALLVLLHRKSKPAIVALHRLKMGSSA